MTFGSAGAAAFATAGFLRIGNSLPAVDGRMTACITSGGTECRCLGTEVAGARGPGRRAGSLVAGTWARRCSAGEMAREREMKSLFAVLAAMAALAPAAAVAGNAILAQAQTPEVCTQIYQPVCGTDKDGKRVTYSNACFARAANATNVTPGECPK